ncbi:phenoxybenzoate dioxygenase subunit beta [Plectosphaerella plurivora]|uniref:Phenoxybenzoate dioxygenase subunit beta n=1 Tax=Plectosphaerella plurivora TaxID=936078 RepID=A0A9P9A5D8_9PEZI|nr:phenoxybenzoate dioxygenase subunit beta [Plectosphaerella plurivora]
MPAATMSSPDVDLWEPLTSDVVLEVRTSKMKKMPGLEIESGIDKDLQDGPIKVSRLGLEDDEHDPTFHGGVDKAVHGYCSSHYPGWQSEYPEAASRFVPGGFGENLVMARMNERNVCIGDVFSVGTSVLLQVSLPRQPCFKLNHRFQLKNFAPRTKDSSRTGWYYRVLREGEVKAGDPITLVERKWPQWTIERIQEYLHRNQDDDAINEELADIEAMGEESRGAFRKRVAKARAKAKREAAGGKEKGERWRDFRIVDKKMETDRVVALTLEAVVPEPDAESPGKGGLHVRLLLPNGLQRTYSLVSGGWDRFELGVALEPKSRGGSRWLHDVTPGEGTLIKVGRMTTDVSAANAASNHVFISGGIGITAFLSLMEGYTSIHYNVELHCAVRSAETDFPFRERLEKLQSGPSSDGFTLHLYDGSKGERMDIDTVVRDLKWNSQLYVCGPLKMMGAAQQAVRKHGLGEDEAHFEAFAAETGGDPFQAEVANREGKVISVGEEETLLEALKKAFGSSEVDSSCEVGNCGTCKVGVRSGRVEHRGTALTAAEKDVSMLSCVSRGIGRIVVEI